MSGWHWGTSNAYVDVSESLRSALSKNPYMKIFVASGYYDAATPYFATEYTLNHMGLDGSQRRNFKVSYYESGHMMYIEKGSLAKLKEDATAFIRWATPAQ